MRSTYKIRVDTGSFWWEWEVLIKMWEVPVCKLKNTISY